MSKAGSGMKEKLRSEDPIPLEIKINQVFALFLSYKHI